MLAKIKELEEEIEEAEVNHESRLLEKTKTAKENIVYYGDKVQILLEELLRKNEYTVDGDRNSMAKQIKTLGIDCENIKFNKEDECFENF